MSGDCSAIGQLLAAYCHRVDRGSAAEVAALFAEDAVLEPAYDGDYRLHGRAEVERWYAYYHANFRAGVRHLKHMVMSPLIEIDGDRGSGVAYLLASAVRAATGEGFQVTGTYHDHYLRDGERWLFARRRIEVEWSAPLSSVTERFPPLGFPHGN